MMLNDPITKVRGVSEQLAKKFAILGISKVADVIDYYPRRYEDYSVLTPIAKLKPGRVTVRATLKQAKGRYVRRGLHITEAAFSDDSGSVRIIWFNQPYREKSLKHGVDYYISGQFELSYQRLGILNPSIELVSSFPASTARILAIYRETKGLNSVIIRKAIRETLPLIRELNDTLPGFVVKNQKLISTARAMEAIHFPTSMDNLKQAQQRLGFEEVFSLSLASLLNRQALSHEHAPAIFFKKQLAKDFVSHLPFTLTDDQRRIVWQIYGDLAKDQPMNRLIEGDVGSGKTVVATMAALMVDKAKYQTAFMAPTELLARQHANTIHTLLSPLKLEKEVGLLVGSLSATQKTLARAKIKSGEARFIIGTHALIDEQVDMHRLGLVVIDEQHRFGVEQRKTLMAKAGYMPHVLSLTATPIPRTLALTLYGELDISVLRDKPAQRAPVVTKLVSPNSRSQIYVDIDKQLEDGRQMFVVCPLISESAVVETTSAEQVYERLSSHEFKHRRVGLLHGKMKSAEKNAVMLQFLEGKLDVLVSTTVIEVGIDVPNATIMIIEAADRFGLAQLHQLRGRVGRGDHQGYCYLILSDSSRPTPRLRALQSSNDGFELAELDLTLRGPGAIYGTVQHGQLDLRIAKLNDLKLIAAARTQAQEFIDKNENLRHYKNLSEHVTKLQSVTNLN